MRALAKIDPAPGLKLIEALVPTPGPGDVLVRVQKTALSAAATHIDRWDAWAQRTIRPPVIVGNEFVGLSPVSARASAISTPANSSSASPASPAAVAATVSPATAAAAPPPAGSARTAMGLRRLRLRPAAISLARRRPIPSDVLACFTPLGQVVRAARLLDLFGAHVLITGASALGGMAAAVTRHCGARSVVVADTNPAGLALATALGATRTIDMREAAFDSTLRALDIADGFDFGIETSGHPAALGDLIAHLRPAGQLALLRAPVETTPLDWSTIQGRQLTLHGIGSDANSTDWERLACALHSGLDVTPAIAHCLPFGCFREAFDRAAHGEPGKIILDWDC
jgi:threonine 3-dehydrogenase